MGSHMIQLSDGTYVEVEVSSDRVREVSGSTAERVAASFEDLRPLVLRVCEPLRSLWTDLRRQIEVDSLEVELGISFEAEGNMFVTRATAAANMTLRISFTPRREAPTERGTV